MPRKKKERTKNTPTRRVRSSGPSAKAAVRDSVSIYEAKFSEIGSKVAWCEEQTKELPASESGPLLNDSIITALEQARPLFSEFVGGLRAIGLSKKVVRREAKKAWPLFEQRCARFATPYTLKPLERNALAGGAGSSIKRWPTEKSGRSPVDSLDMRAGGSAPVRPDVAPGFPHAKDFIWVEFERERIHLTPRQADVVRMLAEAGPTFELFHKTILQKLNTPHSALRDTFRGSKLWNRLIISDGKKRTARLFLPPAPE